MVRFERCYRFRTVRYLSYRHSVSHAVVPGVLVLCTVCLTSSAPCCVPVCAYAVCGVCAVLCVLCAVCYVSTSCVYAVFSGYFGNLFGTICQKVKVYAGHLRCHFLDFFGISML